MNAIILAGGLGTRLKNTISELPKVMAPIGEKPFLSYILERLLLHNFDEVILCVGYKYELIKSYYGLNYKSIRLNYSIENPLLGTGGAIKKALAQSTSDHSLVINGDTFLELNIRDMIEIWSFHKRPLMVVRRAPSLGRYETVKISQSQIKGFITRDQGKEDDFINAGHYILPKHFLSNSDLIAPFSFERDILAHQIYYEKFLTFECCGYFIDIGIPDDYVQAQIDLPDKLFHE